MSRQSIQSDLPAFRAGHGTAMQFNNGYSGPALTAATNGLSQYVVPTALMPDRNGYALRLAALNVMIKNPGTGATGGSWTFNLTKQDGTILGTASIVYNAAVLATQVDIRTNGIGQPLKPGDTVSLNLTAVPTGVLTGLTSVSVEVLAESYGIEA